MPAFKKQHYVPQHYLRQFGYTDTDTISLARIDPYKFVSKANIRHQCQEDYFYGDDGELEALLGLAESDTSPTLAAVCRNKDFSDGELGALKMLAVLLNARTQKSIEAAKLFPKKVFSDFVEHGIETGKLPAPEGGWSSEMVDVSGMAKMMIAETIPCLLEMLSLNCKILQITDDAAFITSDHPVLTLNQFAEGAHSLRNFVGFAQSGFQLLLPISPKLCLYFYDGRTYKVGSRHGRLITITKQDVEIINSLQIQSAHRCIYFNETTPEHRARGLIEKYILFRRPIQDALRTLPGRTPNEEILYMQTPPLKVARPWAFSRVLNIGKAQPGERRDPLWTEAIGIVMSDLEVGRHRGTLSEHLYHVLSEMPVRD